MAPGAPLTIARSASGANGAPADRISRATSPAPSDRRTGEQAGSAAVHPEDDLGVEDPEQRVEVPGSGRRQERVDDATLDGHVGVRARRALADASPGATRQLTGGRGRLADDVGDLVERHGKDVVEHERQALGRRQRLEHDQERDPDGVGHDDVALRAVVQRRGHDRLRQPAAGVVLASRPARSEHVQADAADDDREPATKVIGASRVPTIEPDPCLLDGVIGLADRAEHPIRDASQVRSLALELLGQPFPSCSMGRTSMASRLSVGIRIPGTGCDICVVESRGAAASETGRETPS